jgi:hypothetical protein
MIPKHLIAVTSTATTLVWQTTRTRFALTRATLKKQLPRTRLTFWFASVALAATCAVQGQTTSEAMLHYHTGISGYVKGTVGWSFQPQTRLSVTSLGCLADFVGLVWGLVEVQSVSVGLWATNGSLLGSCSVTTNSTLVTSSRYEPISPVLLEPAQTYYVGASDGPDGFTVLDVVVPSEGGSATMAPEVKLGVLVLATNSIFEFPAPDMDMNEPGSAFVLPNFRFTVAPPALRLSISLTNHSALLTVSGSNGARATLEWVTNATDWTASSVLTTNTVPYSFIDLGASNSTTRFYRAVNLK